MRLALALAALATLLTTGVDAAAAPASADIAGLLSNNFLVKGPRFLFTSRAPVVDKTWTDVNIDHTDKAKLIAPTIAMAAAGKVAWVASKVQRRDVCYGLGPNNECKDHLPRDTVVLILVEEGTKAWTPVAAHIAIPLSDRAMAKAIEQGAKLDPIARKIEPQAADAAKLFETSIAEPKRLAATVSAREDAVLLGSAPDEKVIGGKAVAARLLAWKLAFAVRDGVQAGAAAGGTVAWVAANVDARPAAKADAKPLPFRALAIYEKTGAAWQLVALQFSFIDIAPPT